MTSSTIAWPVSNIRPNKLYRCWVKFTPRSQSLRFITVPLSDSQSCSIQAALIFWVKLDGTGWHFCHLQTTYSLFDTTNNTALCWPQSANLMNRGNEFFGHSYPPPYHNVNIISIIPLHQADYSENEPSEKVRSGFMPIKHHYLNEKSDCVNSLPWQQPTLNKIPRPQNSSQNRRFVSSKLVRLWITKNAWWSTT